MSPRPDSTLSHEEKARISGNRKSALLRLRESSNRKAALVRLRASKFKYKAGTPVPSSLPQPIGITTDQKLSVDGPNKAAGHKPVLKKRVRFASPLVVGPSVVSTPTTLEEKLVVGSSRWTLMDLPGLSLRNSLNKCWFHSSLHLLSTIPKLRTWCLSSRQGLSLFEKRFLGAIQAIFKTKKPADVHRFFDLVKDFDGVNRRYGQVAVPDFIEFLCNQSVNLSPMVKFTLTTQLQCSKCNWVSQRSSTDVFLKLYLPRGGHTFTLADLVEYNSNVVLTDSDAVFCGHCNIKTSHSLSRKYNPDLFLVEVVRATESSRNTWLKSNACINFSATSLKLPGFSRSYRVISTCHHRGSVNGGHWLTKIATNTGWYELDDLRSKNSPTIPPGFNDDSVTVILLIAEDKL